MFRYIISLLSVLCLTVAPAFATVVETSPGRLAENIASLSAVGDELIVKGSVNASDFEAFESLKINRLDLSEVKIAELSAIHAAASGLKYSAADELPPYCFFASKINEIILPASIVAIGDGAFANSVISSITIPAGVTSIGDFAFYNCRNLKNVVIPAVTGALGRETFGKCAALTSADLSVSRIKSLPCRLFAGCSALKKLSLPTSLTEIGREALVGSGLTNIDLANVVSIGDYALSDCRKLKSVTLNPDSDFGTGVLMNCNVLTEINGMPEDVPDLFAANCNAVDPALYSEDFRNVGKYSFANSELTTLILSSGLTHIDRGAFANSAALTLIEAIGLASYCPDVDEDAFAGLDTSEIRLHVDSSHEDAWLSHPVWSKFHVYSDTYDDVRVPVADDSAIRISVANGVLTVLAPEIINSVELFSLNGLRLMSLTPREQQVSVQLTGITAENGVIIIRVSTDSASKTAKIIL